MLKLRTNQHPCFQVCRLLFFSRRLFADGWRKVVLSAQPFLELTTDSHIIDSIPTIDVIVPLGEMPCVLYLIKVI